VRIELRSTVPPTYHRRSRPWQWIGAVAVVAVIAIAAWVVSWVGVPRPLAAGGAVGLLASICLYEYAWRQARRRHRDRSPVLRHWVITDDEVRVAGDGSSRVWRWSAVVAVDEHREVYLLRQVSGAALDIPRPALDPGKDAELRALLTQRGLLPSTGRTGRAA
jgi:hypothetical protein